VLLPVRIVGAMSRPRRRARWPSAFDYDYPDHELAELAGELMRSAPKACLISVCLKGNWPRRLDHTLGARHSVARHVSIQTKTRDGVARPQRLPTPPCAVSVLVVGVAGGELCGEFFISHMSTGAVGAPQDSSLRSG